MPGLDSRAARHWDMGRADLMYSTIVEATFPAVHRIRRSDGTREQPHEHDWLVRAHFTRANLDDSGMVVDFDIAQSALEDVVADLRYADLCEHAPFAGLNPTAENVARYIFDRIRATGLASISRVDVTEAAGCTAAYETA